MQEKSIKVMVVDDMEAHRRRLQHIISKHPNMELIKSAQSGSEAVKYAAIYEPDIILMDIEMEDKLAGITAAKKINQKFPNIKIIILTVHQDDNIIFAAFQTGIVGYVIKTEKNDVIINTIISAYHNLSPIRPIIVEKIRNEFQRIKSNEESILYIIQIISELTPSELEILKLLCEHKTRKQIAQSRCVELSTIKKQINSILKKFNKKNSKEVVKIINDMKIFDILKKI